jgi:hypothetical protein
MKQLIAAVRIEHEEDKLYADWVAAWPENTADSVAGGPGVDPGERVACSVCLETLCDTQLRAQTAPCGHTFHPMCVLQWMDIKQSCPVCRFPFQGNMVDDMALAALKEYEGRVIVARGTASLD